MAPAAAEAAEGGPGAASTARTGRRRLSVAQTPAAAAAGALAGAGEGAAARTAASMRGRRRRSSVSPVLDSAAKKVPLWSLFVCSMSNLPLLSELFNNTHRLVYCDRQQSVPALFLAIFFLLTDSLPALHQMSARRLLWPELTQSLAVQEEAMPAQTRGARRVPARLASMVELSLGPPQGSLGVIMEEGSEEAGSEADEGQSAPQAEAAATSQAEEAPAKGKKRCSFLHSALLCAPQDWASAVHIHTCVAPVTAIRRTGAFQLWQMQGSCQCTDDICVLCFVYESMQSGAGAGLQPRRSRMLRQSPPSAQGMLSGSLLDHTASFQALRGPVHAGLKNAICLVI